MLSNSGHDENNKYSGGAAGDQGGEWARIKWYNRPWTVVLRHPDQTVRSMIAQLAGEAADNDKIGYDQMQRTTFWQQLKSVGYYPSKITVNCEADCSAGVAAIVKAVGYILGLSRLQAVSQDMYTGNQKSALTSAGFSALTDSKYLTSDQYLVPGDILLYEGHHTAINLDYGSKVSMAITNEAIKNSVANVAKRAKAEGWPYGDCHTNPPCPPIACDRGIFRALWDLDAKFRDQKAGGETVYTADAYLRNHGFTKSTKIRNNSIVFFKWDGSKAFDWRDHIFFLVTYDATTGKCSKYDFGSNDRIKAGGYFANVPFDEWSDKTFYACYYLPENTEDQTYTFSPATVKSGSTGQSQYLANRILLAREYKGVKKDGKEQNLELNGKFTPGDIAALVKYKWDRIINGRNLCTGRNGDVIDNPVWLDMTGLPLPIQAVNVPDKCKSGPLVLLLQEILRSENFVGADEKPLGLDQQFGPNTQYALTQYQKVYGLPQTGKATYSVWKHMFTNLTPKAH